MATPRPKAIPRGLKPWLLDGRQTTMTRDARIACLRGGGTKLRSRVAGAAALFANLAGETQWPWRLGPRF
eukprot:6860043-Lingulodinium_polyedra.AAC.1